MTSTIITKNSSTASSVPSSGSLTQGELAVNVTDKKLYTKDSGGTVVKLVGSLGNQEASAAAITGGSINGTTVGASTASTGAFTTLSASSTVSGTGFSTYLASPPAIGGTAAAAGSFTTLSASGAVTLSGGTANGVAYLNGSKVVTSGSGLTFDGTTFTSTAPTTNFSGANFAMQMGTAATYGYIGNSNSQSYLQINGSSNGTPNVMIFGVASSEGMRLTGTGLGIGTTSPAGRLTLRGAAGTSGKNQGILLEYSNGTEYGALGLNNGSGWPQLMARASAGITFHVNSDLVTTGEAMRLDASGNLGLGVTPSAWRSEFKVLQLNARTSIFGSADSTFLSTNEYIDSAGTARYIQTGSATRYRQDDRSHIWSYAASGTAGNAITFTQAMTLDASGNLGVGTTSPSSSFGFSRVLELAGTTAALVLNPSNTTSGAGIEVKGAAPLRFTTNNTEAARIDSSGALLVGTTSVPNTSGTKGVALIINDGNSGRITIGKTVSGTESAMLFYYSGTAVGSITYSDTATAYNTSSDYRLKNTIAPMTGALAKVALLKPCTYKWNADGSDGEGFIAHELAEVVPQCVTGEKDAVDENGNPKYQGIDTSFLVATLTAAIQELKAEFDAYKASHP